MPRLYTYIHIHTHLSRMGRGNEGRETLTHIKQQNAKYQQIDTDIHTEKDKKQAKMKQRINSSMESE